MSKLSFPYVVKVYKYNEAQNEYRMEYCDTTLREYIRTKNATLSFAARKRIALQLLYGINYLHHRRLLHRDISLQNILLKVFDAGAVLVKLSDFGLRTCEGLDRGLHSDPDRDEGDGPRFHACKFQGLRGRE